jgi:hypothetical protein
VSHLAINTNLPDCPECIEVEELLDYEEVWRHLFYLWKWAFDNDFQSGIVKLTPRTLARHAQWSGDAQAFFDALCQPVGPNKVPWLINKGKGYFYLRGWSRNERFFKKKEQGRERQRRYREKFDALRDAKHNASLTEHVYPDRSQSQSQSQSRSPPPPRSPPRSPPLSTIRSNDLVVSGGIQTVWNHWLEKKPTSRRKTLSAKSPEHRLIKKRLADYSAEDLCKAIDGMFLDRWSVDHDKLEIGWALRQDEKHNNLDRFLATVEKEPAKPMDALDPNNQWLDEHGNPMPRRENDKPLN